MRTLLIPTFTFTCLMSGMAEEPAAVEITSRPRLWPSALPVLSPKHTLLVLDMPTLTHLRGFPIPWNQSTATSEAEIGEQVATVSETLRKRARVDLAIEWLSCEKPVDFKRSISPATGMIRSSCRFVGTTITRTVLVDPEDETVFIHLLANKPGALAFRVFLTIVDQGDGIMRIEDRRQLIWTPKEKAVGSIGAHVWVIPFESAVKPEGDTISVRGEGEALILLSYASDSGAGESLAGTLKRLGDRHDPGHFPADPVKIWHGVLGERLKSVENSP